MTDLDLKAVRARADELGIEYHPANKAETIQEKIDAHLAKGTADVPVVEKELTPEQKDKQRLKEALALIPITLTPLDPADAQVPSVAVSVGNKVLGQVTKVIPFNKKWYMPRILVDELEQKKFIRNTMIPTPDGKERLDTQYVKKYGIQYHPMPTPEELKELAKLQLQGNELAK